MQSGRDVAGVLQGLEADRCERVLCCTAPTARGIPAAEVASAAASIGAAAEATGDVEAALDRALELAGAGDAVIVTGSFTVVGAAKVALNAS